MALFFVFQIGVLWVGSILSVGLIPPGETDVYSSTICQVKIDEEVAPGGMQVFGFAPHMHLLGRRLWTDRLVRSDRDMNNGSTVMDINQLEKVWPRLLLSCIVNDTIYLVKFNSEWQLKTRRFLVKPQKSHHQYLGIHGPHGAVGCYLLNHFHV